VHEEPDIQVEQIKGQPEHETGLVVVTINKFEGQEHFLIPPVYSRLNPSMHYLQVCTITLLTTLYSHLEHPDGQATQAPLKAANPSSHE
jgi:hypothetical protein